MSFAFRYELFFPAQALEEVMLAVAAKAEPLDHQVLVIFPDQSVLLPLQPQRGTESPLFSADGQPEWQFVTSLKMVLDEPLLDYARSSEQPPRRRKLGQPYSLNYIYLTVHKGRDVPRAGGAYTDLVMFEFLAATSSMSLVFVFSQSVRQFFVRFLKKHQGICGLLNTEMQLEVVWWKDKPLGEPLPQFWMTLPEIEQHLGSSSGI